MQVASHSSRPIAPRPRTNEKSRSGIPLSIIPRRMRGVLADLASPFERDRHTFEGEFFTSAITRTRRRPRKQWVQHGAACSILFRTSLVLPSLVSPCESNGWTTDRLSLILRLPLRFIRRIIRDRAPSARARAFSAYGRGSERRFTLLGLQFSSFKVLPHYHITYPVS